MKVDLSKVRNGPTTKQIDFIVRNHIMNISDASKLTFEEAKNVISDYIETSFISPIISAWLDKILAPDGEINGQYIYDDDDFVDYI